MLRKRSFTGRYVINPLNGDKVLIFSKLRIGDYGTGCYGCPAHDQRDFEFSKKYNLPIKVKLFSQKVKNLMHKK